jgi:hypothetical protein
MRVLAILVVAHAREGKQRRAPSKTGSKHRRDSGRIRKFIASGGSLETQLARPNSATWFVLGISPDPAGADGRSVNSLFFGKNSLLRRVGNFAANK